MTLIVAGVRDDQFRDALAGTENWMDIRGDPDAFMFADSLTLNRDKTVFSNSRRKIHRVAPAVRILERSDMPKSSASRKVCHEVLVGTAGNGLLGGAAVLEMASMMDQVFLVPEEAGWGYKFVEIGDSPVPLGHCWEREAIPDVPFGLDRCAEFLAFAAERVGHEVMNTNAPRMAYNEFYSDLLLLGYCDAQQRQRVFQLNWLDFGNRPEIQVSECLPGSWATIGYKPAAECFRNNVDKIPVATKSMAERGRQVMTEIVIQRSFKEVGGHVLEATSNGIGFNFDEIRGLNL